MEIRSNKSPGKKIKVLHIITHLEVGGAQDNTIYTCEKLDRKLFDVALASNGQGEWKDRVHRIKNLEILEIPHLVREINIIQDILAFMDLIRIIRRGHFDIIHTHSTKPGVLGRLAAKITGVPLVVHTVHGFPFYDQMPEIQRRFYIGVEKLMGLFCQQTITVSKLNLAKIVRLGIAQQKSVMNIYSGINFNKFDKTQYSTIKQELGISNQTCLIGTVGRLSDQKDPFNFLRAIPAVIKSHRNVHFIFVGEGRLRSDMESYITRNGLQSRITLLGNREDIPNIMKGMDIFVLSSKYEGLGRSLTEAMYCKVPVVATAVEGVPELVKNRKTGRLVEPGNSHELANGIISLLVHSNHSATMANRAYRIVSGKFNINTMVKQIGELYLTKLKRKKVNS